MNLDSIARVLHGELVGDGSIEITDIVPPNRAQNRHQLAIIVEKKFFPALTTRRIQTAVINRLCPIDEPTTLESYVLTDLPGRHVMACLTSLFHRRLPREEPLIHPTAEIGEDVRLGDNVAIGAFTVIHPGVTIGENATIHSQVTIGENSTIGADVSLYPGVRIGANVEIGERCVIHQNTCIGADGFSFHVPHIEPRSQSDQILKIYSLSGVVLGEDVEVGSNSNIDAGTLAPTRIGDHTKIDSLVQIGHNCQIGSKCIICGQVGIAGSVTIGDYGVLAGAVGVGDNVTIGERAIVLAYSAVGDDLAPYNTYFGVPAAPAKEVMARIPYLKRLKTLYKKVLNLETRIEKLE